jgi:hypothetical protein
MPRATVPAAPQTTSTLVIDTPQTLDVLARALTSAPLFAFDTETDTTDEMTANLVGLSFAIGAGEAYYIPVGHGTTADGEEPPRQLPLKDVIERLRPALTDPKVGKTAHNAKFDMMLLSRQGVWVEGLQGDTMVAAYLINPGRRGLGLKELAFENLGVIMTPISELIGTGKKQITMAQVPIRTAADYANALHLVRPRSDAWTARVLTCSALLPRGVDEVWNAVEEHRRRRLAEDVERRVRALPVLLVAAGERRQFENAFDVGVSGPRPRERDVDDIAVAIADDGPAVRLDGRGERGIRRGRRGAGRHPDRGEHNDNHEPLLHLIRHAFRPQPSALIGTSH